MKEKLERNGMELKRERERERERERDRTGKKIKDVQEKPKKNEKYRGEEKRARYCMGDVG